MVVAFVDAYVVNAVLSIVIAIVSVTFILVSFVVFLLLVVVDVDDYIYVDAFFLFDKVYLVLVVVFVVVVL